MQVTGLQDSAMGHHISPINVPSLSACETFKDLQELHCTDL